MTAPSAHPQTCTNSFLEEDGYCVKCGKNHFLKSFKPNKNAKNQKLAYAYQMKLQGAVK